MKKFLYLMLFIAPLAVNFNVFGDLSNQTITLRDATEKPVIIKIGSNSYTLNQGQAKIFKFDKFKKVDAGFPSMGFYRSLDSSELAQIALKLIRDPKISNVNVDLIKGSFGSLYGPKIANISYGSPTRGATRA